uniref:Mitochondrial ribosomal protein S21 n=1 Tax=Plectus sambesii TaxID=2011161 RepID=A0A914UXM2_9BILA
MVRVWRGGIGQPFGSKLFAGIWAAHARWTNRTVLVEKNDVDAAFKLLNMLMDREGLTKIIRRTQYFEKPYEQRNRMAYEQCRAIYDEDMNRKIKFLMRKNRKDPFPGQMTT